MSAGGLTEEDYFIPELDEQEHKDLVIRYLAKPYDYIKIYCDDVDRARLCAIKRKLKYQYDADAIYSMALGKLFREVCGK